MFRASKLWYSVSTSGPSSTAKPSETNSSSNSRWMRVMGCRWPRRGPGAGSVRSSHSRSRRARSAASRELFFLASSAASSSPLASLSSLPARARSSGASLPICLKSWSMSALAAEHLHAHGLQLLERARRRDARQRTGHQFLDGRFEHGCGISYSNNRRAGFQPAMPVFVPAFFEERRPKRRRQAERLGPTTRAPAIPFRPSARPSCGLLRARAPHPPRGKPAL